MALHAAGEASAGDEMAERRSDPGAVRLSTILLLVVASFGVVGSFYLVMSADRTDVLIASHLVPSYRQLNEDDFDVYPMATRDVKDDAVTSKEDVIGKYLTVPLERGQPLTISRLGPRLPAGAIPGPLIAFTVSPESALGGRVARGDQCTVLTDLHQDGASEKNIVLDNVLLLDITGGSTPAVVLAITRAQQDILTSQGPPRSVLLIRTAPYSTPSP
jgi:Flp pilus assembly protein CpaB